MGFLKGLARLAETVHGREVVERRSRQIQRILFWCLAGFGVLVLIGLVASKFSDHKDRRTSDYALNAFCSAAKAEAASAPGFLDLKVNDLDRARGATGDRVAAVYTKALAQLADEHPDEFPGCQPARYCPQWLAAVDHALFQADPEERRTIRDICENR